MSPRRSTVLGQPESRRRRRLTVAQADYCLIATLLGMSAALAIVGAMGLVG